MTTESMNKYCPRCAEPLISREIDGKTRLCCPSEECGHVFWDNPVPVVAAIVEYRGEVLLARNVNWPGKMFGLVTGFLEKNETPEEGVVREVGEEFGLDVLDVSFVGIYPFFQMNQLIIAYHVTAEGSIVLGEELAEVKSIPVDRLRPWPFGTGLALEDWINRRKRE